MAAAVTRFGDYELEAAAFELRCRGERAAMESQVFDVLAYLVTHCDRVVTKDEIIEHGWPSGSSPMQR